MTCIALHLFNDNASIRVKGVKKGDAFLVNGKENDDDFFNLESLVKLKASPEIHYTTLNIVYEGRLLLPGGVGETMRLAILQWLIDVDQLDKTFDCFSFANAIHGEKFPRAVDYSYMIHGPGTGSDIIGVNRTSLVPLTGDLIFFYDSKTNQIKHFAVYLADDLYLFKYGMGGPIHATGVRTLCELYECDLCVPVVQICHNCVCDATSSKIRTIKSVDARKNLFI